VDFCCLNIGAVISQIQGNKVKGAVTTKQRVIEQAGIEKS
jgi:hypothetical protein